MLPNLLFNSFRMTGKPVLAPTQMSGEYLRPLQVVNDFSLSPFHLAVQVASVVMSWGCMFIRTLHLEG